MALRPYYRLEEGCGGITNFPIVDDVSQNNNNTNAIGTTGCDTCVGIYFALPGNRCFAAHIFAYIDDIAKSDLPEESKSFLPNDEQGESLQQKITFLLGKEFDEWKVSTLKARVRNAIVVCPRREEMSLLTVGGHVVTAFEKFFDVTLHVHKNAHGFAVDYTDGGSPDLFGFQTTEGLVNTNEDDLPQAFECISDEDCGWMPINPEDDIRADKAWKLVYVHGEWHVADGEESSNGGQYEYDDVVVDTDAEAALADQ